MCDYSLHHVATRPAKIEDKLVTTKFHNSITRGFAALDNPRVAVCLLPGTEIAFEKEVRWDAPMLGVFPKTRTLGDKVARFRQVNKEQPHTHHDALEFPNGETVLVTFLHVGRRVTVLQLPAQPKMPAQSEAQTGITLVG